MESNRIALVVLLDGDLVDSPEHLGVASLAAQLRASDFEVRIFDVPPGLDEAVCEAIAEFAPSLAGFSLTTVNLPRSRAFGTGLRSCLGERCHIVLGGPIATFQGGELLDLPGWEFADSLFRGEADLAIVEIARLATGAGNQEVIPGFYRRGHPPPPPRQAVASVADLTSLAWPARDQLAAHPRLPYVRISTTRGCTSACSFCNAPHAGNHLAGGKLWRQRSPESIVQELAAIVEQHHVDTFDFVDSTFEDPSGSTIGKERVGRIADLLLESGLRIYFNICCQAINWHSEDRPLIAKLHRAGLEKVLIGVESGDPRALKRYGKRASVEDNLRSIALFRERGIYVAFGFIMFDPLGDFEEVEVNAQFLHDNIGHNFRRYLTRMELYPGAAAIHMIEREGLLDPSYRNTLNPYAYHYRDPRLERLAADMTRIISDSYVHDGSALSESPIVAFETFSIQSHTLLSRLARFHEPGDPIHEIIEEGEREIAALYQDLSDRNFNDFMDGVERAKRELPPSEGYATRFNQRYKEAISALQTIKLRTNLRIRRAGGDPAKVQSYRERVPLP